MIEALKEENQMKQQAERQAGQKLEQLTQLASCLQDSKNIPEERRDFRRLVAKYICLAPPGEESLCTRVSPGPSGKCSLKVQIDRNENCICLYTGGVT